MRLRKNSETGVSRIMYAYNKIKSEPLRTWLLKDIFLSSDQLNRNYIECLVKLGLVERVGVIYKAGRGYNLRREVKGYRLKPVVYLKNNKGEKVDVKS